MLHLSEHSSSSGGTNSLSQHIVTNHHHNPIVTKTQPSSIQYAGLRDPILARRNSINNRLDGGGLNFMPQATSEAFTEKVNQDAKPQDNVSNPQVQSIKIDKGKNTFKMKEEDESVGIEEEKKEGALGPHVQKPTPSQNRPALRLNLDAVRRKIKPEERGAHFTLGRLEDMHNIEENDLNEHSNAGNVGVDSERLFRVQNWRQAPSISNITGEDVFYSARSHQMLRLQNNVMKAKPSQSNPSINQQFPTMMQQQPVNDQGNYQQVQPSICININELHINQQNSPLNANSLQLRQGTFGSQINRVIGGALNNEVSQLNYNSASGIGSQKVVNMQQSDNGIQSQQFFLNNQNNAHKQQIQKKQNLVYTQGQRFQGCFSPSQLQHQKPVNMVGQQVNFNQPQKQHNLTGYQPAEVLLVKNMSNQTRGSEFTRKQLQRQTAAGQRTQSVNQSNNQGIILIQKSQMNFKSPKVGVGAAMQVIQSQVSSRQHTKKSGKSLRVQSSSKQKPKGNFVFPMEEEERVPNEHPSKINAMGVGYYQTNYFSQIQDQHNHFHEQIIPEAHAMSERFSKTTRLQQHRNPTRDSKEEEKSPQPTLQNNFESYGGGSFTAKKRQPTLMPYNLPGDDIEQFERGEVLQRQALEMSINPFDQSQFIQAYAPNFKFQVGEGEFIDSENFVSLDPTKLYAQDSAAQIGAKKFDGKLQLSSALKDSKDMSKSELINEVDVLRMELKKRDIQLKKHAIEGQRLKRESQHLSMKLRMEVQNSTMLLKNMNRMRHNYFQSINSPAPAQSNASPKTNKQDSGVGFDQMYMSNQGLQRDKKSNNRQESALKNASNRASQILVRASPILQHSDVIRSQKQSSNRQMIAPQGLTESIAVVQGQAYSVQNLQIKFQNIISEAQTPQIQNLVKKQANIIRGCEPIQSQQLQIPSEPPSEQSSFINHQAHLQELPPPPKIHAFQPPTRASVGAQQNIPPNYHRIGYIQGHSGFMSRGLGVSNGRRSNLQHLLINQRRTNQGVRVPQNLLDEDGSLIETQYNDDSILINRVNEMQIKTSRFDQPFLHFGHLTGHHQNYYRHEDFIPSEEPLINVREFWDQELNQNHRMIWPIQGTLHGQRRMRIQNGGLQAFGYYERAYRNHLPQAYIQLPTGNMIPVRNQQQVLTTGQRRLVAPQGNYTQAINAPSRRGYAQHNHEAQGLRLRVASQGPPLRNINGDSHSLLEEDYIDQTHQIIGGNDQGQNTSNIILSASGNPVQISSQNQLMQSDDSIIDLEDEERHHDLPMRNQQIFMQFNNNNRGFRNFRPMGGPNAGGGPMNGLHAGGFSFDDGGMDEYDVADERVHLFEYINPDNMTYEEMIALQDRIGYVTKGLTLQQINSFPKMKRKEVLIYLQKIKGGDSKEEEKKEVLQLEAKSPQPEEQRKRQTRKFYPKHRRSAEDDIDEIVDGDEGIVNRRLPINQYNHQVSPDCPQPRSANSFKGPYPLNTANFGQFRSQEEEDGIENCREEDEERIETDGLKSMLPKEILEESKDNMAFELDYLVSADNALQVLHAHINAEELQVDGHPGQLSHVISESKDSATTMHNERCAVCFDSMLKNDFVKVLTCGHYYHIECIDQWLLVEKRCPMCMMYLDGSNHREKKA